MLTLLIVGFPDSGTSFSTKVFSFVLGPDGVDTAESALCCNVFVLLMLLFEVLVPLDWFACPCCMFCFCKCWLML